MDLAGQPLAQGSQITVDGNQADIYPIGTDGTVMLYGLVDGTYKLTVRTSGGRSCQTTLVVPKKVENQTPEIKTLQCK